MSVFTSIDNDYLEVYPGGGASTTVRVRNTGGVVNEYRVEVLGPSAGWAEVEPAVLPLFPGNEGTLTVTWRPLRNSDAKAGVMPFGLRVVPAEHPEDSRVEEGSITLGAYYAMGVSLVPVTSRGRFGAGHRVVVHNQSNADAAVALTALDPDALLRFHFRPSAFRLAPGAERSIKLRVRPRRHKIRGHEEHRNFQLFASQQGQEPQRVDGTFVQRALVAGWQFKVALFAVVLLIAGLFLANYRQGKAQTLADDSIPLPPVPVRLTPLSTTTLRMTWSGAGVNIFSGYEIQSNGQTVATPSGDETAHVFTGLNPGQRYCYMIRSLEPKNTKDPASVFSPQVCQSTDSIPLPPKKKLPVAVAKKAAVVGATAAAAAVAPAVVKTAAAPKPGAPAAPVPVTAQVIDANDIKLSWTPRGGSEFVVQDGGQQVATPGATESAHTFAGLTPNSTHCYVIWAVGPGGSSPHVVLPCTTTIGPAVPPAPLPPTTVKAAAVSNTAIQVSWTDDSSGVATAYQIFENGSEVATQPAGATGYTFSGLAPNSHHCYAVRSVTATNQSAFAPDSCATVSAAVPPTVNLTAAGVYSLTASSITPSEGDGRAVIGAVVNYSVVVNIPISGVKQAVLNVSLPATTGGLAVQSDPSTNKLGVALTRVDPALSTDVTGGFATAVSQAAVNPGASGTPDGQVLSINLGDVTNSSPSQTQAQTIAFDIPAVVLNTPTNTDTTALTISGSLTSLVGGTSTTSPAVTNTISVANPAPTMTFAQASNGGGTVTVTLGSQAGAIIYAPQVEIPGFLTCTSASETNGGTTSGCGPGSQAVNFSPLPSGAGSTITLTLGPADTADTIDQSGCPSGLSVEWLSSTATNQALSGNDATYAWPRSGPDDDPRPTGSSTSLPGTDGDQVFATCSA